MMVRRQDPYFNTPVEFLISDEGDIDLGHMREPDWGLHIAGERPFYSKTADGLLQSDYLVISRLPNLWSQEHTIVNFGGLHGPGTAATTWLLRNEKLLERFYAQVRELGAEHWQAVIEVTAVGRDQMGNSNPLALSDKIRLFPVTVRKTLAHHVLPALPISPG
jgi:hypothetical protein